MIQSIPSDDYIEFATLSDDDNGLLDELSSNDNNDEPKISEEQENMRKYFELLTKDQQQLLTSKLPLLCDITALDKRNEIFIKKLQLCEVAFDFYTTVSYYIFIYIHVYMFRETYTIFF